MLSHRSDIANFSTNQRTIQEAKEKAAGRGSGLDDHMEYSQQSMDDANDDGEMDNDENFIPTSQEYAATMRRRSHASVSASASRGSSAHQYSQEMPLKSNRKRNREAETERSEPADEHPVLSSPIHPNKQNQHISEETAHDDEDDDYADPEPEFEAIDDHHPSLKRAKKGGPMAEFDASKIKDMKEDCGTIEHIELVNIMCHSYLQVNLNSNINFVIGHNGSGKSAILTALTICLGGKASFTNRASSVKNLLKEGTTMGSITVRIRNMGPDAYKPEFYGKKIIIERRISKEGSNGYKIKSEKGTLISTLRDEVTAICDHLSIAIDNPMAILTQDTSRMFLANSTPKDKYNFFLKGTLLAQLSADHALLNEYISRASGTLNIKEQALPEMKKNVDELKTRWKEIEKWQDLEKTIDEEKNKMAWAFVNQKEEELQKVEKEKERAEAKLENTLPHIRESEEKIATYKNEKIDIGDQMNALKETGAPLVDRMKALKNDQRNQKDKLRDIKNEETRINREISKFSNERDDYQKKIDVEARKLLDSIRDLREEKQREKEELKEVLQQENREVEQAMADIDKATASRNEVSSRRVALERSVAQARNDVNRKRQALEEMKGGKTDMYAAFPMGTANILRAIDQVHARGGWRGIKPVGPLGLHCKLRKQEYSHVIESVLGGSLNGYVVSDSADSDRLKRILKENRCERQAILMFKGQLFDFRQGEPDSRYLTILRCLQIEDPYVLRALIVNNEIEKTVLVASRQEGDDIAEEGNFRQKNISSVYTKDNIKLGGRGGGLQTTALTHEHRGRPRIEVDMQAYIERAEDDLQNALREHANLEAQLKVVEDEERQIASKINQLKTLERSISTRRVRTKQKIDRLEEELKDQQPNQINTLEDYKAEAEQKISVLQSQLTAVRAQIAEIEAAIDQMAEEIKGVEKETHVIQQEHDALKQRLLTNESAMVAEKRSIEHYIGRRDEYKVQAQQRAREYEEKKEEVDKEYEMALEMTGGERLKVKESPEKLARSIKDMEAKLKEKRKQTGSKEDVLKQLTEKKEEYVSAKRDLFYTKEAVNNLKVSLIERARAWANMRKYISMRARTSFTLLMNTRGYFAKLELDHARQILDLRVDVNRKKDTNGEFVHAAPDESGGDLAASEKDPRTLSGGEKSYSTVCLLLSLWESMANPFRALDEFDVFMDAVNRRISMKLMIEHARTDAVSRQYIFITPQDMSHVPGLGSSDVRIIKLQDPERNQRTLNFAGAGPRQE
ncbi:Structural maintenance of chromosomes protein 6 [Dinochytrium kinnereticum]|nr:Structural maintenance of chromosomes protein 6 [Dinochytrium kinnereticum]